MILLLKKIYINMKSSMFSNTFMFINCGSIYVYIIYIYVYGVSLSWSLSLSRLSQHEWTTSFCPCKLSNKVSLRPPTSHLQDKHRQGVQNLFLLRYNSSHIDDNLQDICIEFQVWKILAEVVYGHSENFVNVLFILFKKCCTATKY